AAAAHPLSARYRFPARLHRGRREGIPPGRREGTPYGRREDTPCGRRQGVQRGRREGVPRARRCPAMKAADQSMIDAREAGPAQTIDRAGSAAAAGGVSAAVAAPVRGPDAGPGGGGPGGFGWWRVFRVVRGPVAVQLAVLAGFGAAGIAVSWPRVTYLAGRLPATRDAGSYVWGFWWVARQVEHLGNPWFTRYIDAPAGAQLGLHALMPLPGVVMMPVTVVFGPSASYNLLSVVMPGLLCYAMYRVARLWLPSQVGAIAAGAFFGLSSMLTWRSWYHLNLAAGALFL